MSGGKAQAGRRGECEFCGDDIHPEDSVACQYCDGVLCSTNCFNAHLVGFPQCGGDSPAAVIALARKNLGFDDQGAIR